MFTEKELTDQNYETMETKGTYTQLIDQIAVPNNLIPHTNTQAEDEKEKTKQCAFFPIDIWNEIFSYLKPSEAMNAVLACKEFNSFFKNRDLQKRILANDPLVNYQTVNKAYLGLILNVSGPRTSQEFYVVEDKDETEHLLLKWREKDDAIIIPKAQIKQHGYSWKEIENIIQLNWISSWGDSSQFLEENSYKLRDDIQLIKEKLPKDIRDFKNVFDKEKVRNVHYNAGIRSKLIKRFNEFANNYEDRVLIHEGVAAISMVSFTYDKNNLEICIQQKFSGALQPVRITIPRTETKEISEVYQECLEAEKAQAESLNSLNLQNS